MSASLEPAMARTSRSRSSIVTGRAPGPLGQAPTATALALVSQPIPLGEIPAVARTLSSRIVYQRTMGCGQSTA
jgi:hypothetical protein